MKNLDACSTPITASSIAASADTVEVAADQVPRLFGRNGLRRRRRFHCGRESTAPKRGSVAAGRSARLQQEQLNVPAAAAEGARKDGKKGDPYLEGERIADGCRRLRAVAVVTIQLYPIPVSP